MALIRIYHDQEWHWSHGRRPASGHTDIGPDPSDHFHWNIGPPGDACSAWSFEVWHTVLDLDPGEQRFKPARLIIILEIGIAEDTQCSAGTLETSTHESIDV